MGRAGRSEDDMYLGWFDDSKKDATEKAKDAITAYRERFGYTPNVLLVSKDEAEIHLGGITIRVENYIRRNNFWVGVE